MSTGAPHTRRHGRRGDGSVDQASRWQRDRHPRHVPHSDRPRPPEPIPCRLGQLHDPITRSAEPRQPAQQHCCQRARRRSTQPRRNCRCSCGAKRHCPKTNQTNARAQRGVGEGCQRPCGPIPPQRRPPGRRRWRCVVDAANLVDEERQQAA